MELADEDFLLPVEGEKKVEDKGSWTIECPHRVYGWRTSSCILIVSAILISILVYCNTVYICHLSGAVYTERDGYRTYILPEGKTVYSINLITDAKELWTGCTTINGRSKCDHGHERKEEAPTLRAMAALLFFWSVCFPFIKIFLSLSFWFLPVPRCIRSWTMWCKVQVGRWSVLELYFIFFWMYGFRVDVDADLSEYLARLSLHIHTCLTFSYVSCAFVAAQLGSLMLSHFIMEKTERMLDTTKPPVRRNDSLAIWSYGQIQNFDSLHPAIDHGFILDDGDKNSSTQIAPRTFSCPNFWTFRGYVPDTLILILAGCNLVILCEIIWHKDLFEAYFTGSVIPYIPGSDNYFISNVWDMIVQIPTKGCGKTLPIVAISFLTIILAPFISSLSLFFFWISLYFDCIPMKVKLFLRKSVAFCSVYSCIDVMVVAQYFSSIYYPDIVSEVTNEHPEEIAGVFNNKEAYYLCMIYPAIHWLTMLHCLSTPMVSSRVSKKELEVGEGNVSYIQNVN